MLAALTHHRFRRVALMLIAALLAGRVAGVESPASYGPVSQLDTPILRLPLMRKLPTIDGDFAASEWEDASALTGFWSRNIMDLRPPYEHLAPHQIQSWIYAGYDREHLYLAYVVAIYPQHTWLKARGRFPDVYGHPLYGLMRDDHIEFELRPYHGLTRGYRYGMFKWFVNPIGVISDQMWTPTEGLGKRWQSNAVVRAYDGGEKWCVEMKIPLAEMKVKNFAGNDPDDQEIMKLPPPDGTAYRVWFKNGIGGAGQYVVLYDQHTWNTTKTKLVLDSQAVGVQVNEIGNIMEDIIDVKVTLKNHHRQSQTVRLGFFVENAAGLIYSSYEDDVTKEGLIELRPGQTMTLALKKKFPGITSDDNFLWFDVRSAGRPAKVLYQCRLTKFHSVDPPPRLADWRNRKLGSLDKMRPPKQDFSFRFQYSPYTKKLSAVIDRGIHGASPESQQATEAKLIILQAQNDEVAVEKTAPFRGDFATFLIPLPDLAPGEYKPSLLLFDANKRIMGERNPNSFYVAKHPGAFPWERNSLGLDDIVWAPFKPIVVQDAELKTLRQDLTVAPTGFPAQIVINPDPRDLPLEVRAGRAKLTTTQLQAMGRGPQLRAPLRLEAVVKGQRLTAKVVEPAKITRQWKSEVEYAAKAALGPVEVELNTQYDCDGAMTFALTYGAEQATDVELLELVMEVVGPVDLRIGGVYGMEPASGWDMTLPAGEGVVWDSALDTHLEPLELYYSKFVPWFFFGNGDRGWSWVCDSDENWEIDREGSTLTLERDAAGQVTMRVKFVNHPARISGKRTIEFALFTHPAKPKEQGYRRIAWLDWRPENYEGIGLKCLPNDGPCGIDGSDETFSYFLRKYPNGAPRLYINKNWVNSGIPELQKHIYTGEWMGSSSARPNRTPMDSKGGYGQPWVRPGRGLVGIEWGSQSWEDYFVYHCERMVRIGKTVGWWWDELFLPARTNCVANGQAYFRKPEEVGKQELPWQSNFGSLNARDMMKRNARLLTKNKVPNYVSIWATSTTALESYANSSEMVESACGFAKTYDIDHIVRFPIAGWRYASNYNKGLTTRVKPYKGLPTDPGDNPRLDRALLGRALLHDIGVSPQFTHGEQLIRTINILHDFGYFDEANTEVLPYWRNRHLLRYGPVFTDDAFEVTVTDPHANVFTTIYRRPYKSANGRQGYKALIVIVNENDEPVRSRLHLLDVKSLLGGANNILVGMEYHNYKAPPARSLGRRFSGYGSNVGLRDLEDGGVVVRAQRDYKPVPPEIYGPVYIRPHEFRVLYAHYDPEQPSDARALGGGLRKLRTEQWRKRRNYRPGNTERPWWETWQEPMPTEEP